LLKNPIGAQSRAGFEGKTVRRRKAYRDMSTDDKPFSTEVRRGDCPKPCLGVLGGGVLKHALEANEAFVPFLLMYA
jgi:hypothetical protein